MNGRHDPRKRLRDVFALAAVLCASTAYAQVGDYLGSPSTFNTPSTSFSIGGRYTRDPGSSIASRPEAYSGGPLSISLVPNMNNRAPASPEGAASYGGTTNLGTLPPSLRQTAMPSAVPSTKPLGQTFGSPLPQTAVPQYERPVSTRMYGFFKPTVTADSMSRLQFQGRAPLNRIAPRGGSPLGVSEAQQGHAGAVVDKPGGAGVGPAAAVKNPAGGGTGPQATGPTATSGKQAEIVRNLSEIKAAQLDQEAADCLNRAVEAAKSANYRGTRDQLGAIALFRQAQILDDKKPDPVVGLLACYLATGDYHQAAALVGPLTRRWPDVLARQDLLDSYGSPEQMRSRLSVVRQVKGPIEDPDLDLLVAFLRWFFESRQVAGSDAARLADAAGPDSSAAALAAAMQQAMTPGGG